MMLCLIIQLNGVLDCPWDLFSSNMIRCKITDMNVMKRRTLFAEGFPRNRCRAGPCEEALGFIKRQKESEGKAWVGASLWYLQLLPRWLSSKVIHLQCRRPKRHRFDPWVRKIPWRRKWQFTPVFLPGKSHGKEAWQATVHGIAKGYPTERASKQERQDRVSMFKTDFFW